MARAEDLVARLAISLTLLGLVAACDGESSDQPSQARIMLFSVQDPDLDPAALAPATILWLSTRSGRAWVATPDGREITDRRDVTGGAVTFTEVWPRDLEPGENRLEVRLAPESGEDALRAAFEILVAAECTRRDHCPPGSSCVDFACE